MIDNRVVYFIDSGNVASGGEMFVASLPGYVRDQSRWWKDRLYQ